MTQQTEYQIRDATPDDAVALSLVMRQGDVDECWAAAHKKPLQALLDAMNASRDAKVCQYGDEILCMFGSGCSVLIGGVSYPWMLSSEKLIEHRRAFLRVGKAYVELLARDFDVIKNVVDARNTVAVKWLKSLGFEIKDPIPFGPDRMPFHPFEMVRTDDV